MSRYPRTLDRGYVSTARSYKTGGGYGLHTFEIIKKLGRGSFASVFLAKERKSGALVALKKMKIDDPTAFAEITIMKKLPRHENVVAMLDYFEDRGLFGSLRLYLVLEYCSGDSLNNLLHKQQLPLELALAYMQDITRGVVHLHQNAIVHCDIKADNILFSPGPGRDIAKVTDFSIGRKLSGSGRSSVKLAPHLKYGPHYSSAPEVYDGGSVTDRSDIYSLGLVLLSFFVHSSISAEGGHSYLITPFGLSSRLYGKALRLVPQQEADRIVDEYVMPSMKNVIMGCLSKDYRQRPFAEDVLRDITYAADTYEKGMAMPVQSERFVHTWRRR